MSRFSTAARRIGVSAVLVAATTLGTATTADATPSGCQVVPSDQHVTVICTSGSGEYRAYTRCDRNNWPDYNRYGRWVGLRQISSATCDAGHRAFNQGLQTR